MKKVLLVVSVLFLFSLTACDDDCANCVQYPPNCIFLSNVIDSECLAEDLVRTCDTYSCRSETYRFSLISNNACTIIDCETLQCDNVRSTIRSGNASMDIEQTGIITILGLTQFPLPFGTIEVEDLENGTIQEEFECLAFTN